MSQDDDLFNRAVQRAKATENERLSDQAAVFVAWRESVREFLARLRADLPVLMDRAEDSLVPMVSKSRSVVGTFRKRTVEEEKRWLGWLLFSWPHRWRDKNVGAHLYLQHNGRLLVAAQEWALLADEMPDDFLVWVLAHVPDTRGNPRDRHVAALYLAAGLPTPEVPSSQDDPRVYLSLTSEAMGEIGAKFEGYKFEVPMYSYSG
jgi:hypothetical protein